MPKRNAKVVAVLLGMLIHRNFNYGQNCLYRLEWSELKKFSLNSELSELYLEEIRKHLKEMDLSLTNHENFLVVDYIGRLPRARSLTKSIFWEHCSFDDEEIIENFNYCFNENVEAN